MPVKGIIFDDDESKSSKIQEAFEEQGGLVVARGVRVFDVVDLFEAGKFEPNVVDVVFIDSHMGNSFGDGKEVLRYLFMHGLARQPIGNNNAAETVIPDSNKIVTVGASDEPEWAAENGSYSDLLLKPLTVDWTIKPLNLAEVVSEIRRLKPAV